MTVREAIAAGARLLAANPDLQPSAGRDAEFLLLRQLGLSRADVLAYPERVLDAEDEVLYWQRIERRATDEPVQYITGEQEFYGLLLQVTPDVLIPRPETEHLVEAVLARLPHDRPARVLDVGTGSGAIALAIARHLPVARVTASDLSSGALAVARRNAKTHGLSDRIQFVESDLLSALGEERFNCIVSNPPYVPETDRASLHPQVRDYEPEGALFAGPDGLDVYRRLIPVAWEALFPGGLLALEIGYGQRQAIADLLRDWEEVSFEDDLQGIPRVALARRPS